MTLVTLLVCAAALGQAPHSYAMLMTPPTPAACERFENINLLLDQAIRDLRAEQDPAPESIRIAIAALRTASAKTSAQLPADLSAATAEALSEYAHAASDGAEALASRSDPVTVADAADTFSLAEEHAQAVCAAETEPSSS